METIKISSILSDLLLHKRIQFIDEDGNKVDGIVEKISMEGSGICFDMNDCNNCFSAFIGIDEITILPKYVVLEHLQGVDIGRRFWSRNIVDNTHLTTGEEVYKEIAFTDSEEEAIKLCS